MTTYVALLRGIGPLNPNMRNDKLRGVLDSLGYGNVRTVITTGNLVFDARAKDVARLERRIEAAWPEQLGFASTTIIRSREEIEALLAADPFAGFAGHDDTKASSFQVTFLQREPAEPVAPHASDAGRYEVVAVLDRAICSVIDETGKPPALLRDLERRLGKAMTTRSWKTVHRIARAMQAG